MASHRGYASSNHDHPYSSSFNHNQTYAAPSAPPMQSAPNPSSYPSSYSSPSPSPSYPSSYPSSYSSPSPSPSYPSPSYPPHGHAAQSYYSGASFPPGTNPEIVRSFMAVDRDRSGFIDERELQSALSSLYRGFSIRTVRLLLFLFKNPRGPSDRIGPAEFAVLWDCLGQWRIIFDRFDRDRSGKIDSQELTEALRGLGYAVPPSVIQVMMSNYIDSATGRGALNFDNFIECGMIVKGITDKFKEKDAGYKGSATFTYESFLTTVIPFIVP